MTALEPDAEPARAAVTSAGRGGVAGWLPRSQGGRLAAGVAAVVVLFGAVVVLLDRLAPTPRGPESSSYATAPAGLAAYADLLRRAGHPVERRRRALVESPRIEGGTLVVLDARAVSSEEAAAIGAFVRGGGRLVAGGARGAPWLARGLGTALPLRGDGEPVSARRLAPVPETAGVRTVRAVDGGALRVPGGSLPLLGSPDAPLATLTRAGRGRVVLLADASPLQNRALALEDNAGLGLALAGAPGEPVTFLETVHGYGASGFGALPERARWALLGLLLAALAFVWSHARRLGPPEEDEQALPPSRAEYVDAVAGALVRTRRPAEVAAPLRTAARDRLARRAGLAADAPERELREAAARFGLGDAETAAVVAGPSDLAGALAAGRALAHLESAASGATATITTEAPTGRGGEGR